MEQTEKKPVNILGVYINQGEKKDFWGNIVSYLDDPGQHQIITVNPEYILAKNYDEELFHILNNAELKIPDGFGLIVAGWLMGARLHRYTGADLIPDILELAQKTRKKVLVLNWKRGLSSCQEIKESAKKRFADLEIEALEIGRVNFLDQAIIKKINSYAPSIIFAALGSPWQDKIIFHDLKLLPTVKIGIGIGGGFDFITDKIRRAPKWARTIGIEWLWRAIGQPIDRMARWKRIWRAVAVFPYEFIVWRFIRPHIYRPNVAIINYKKENDAIKILIFKRAGEDDHWQLPQGGTDGENLEKAGARELREEINTDKFKVIAAYPNLYKYLYGDRLGRFGLPSKFVRGYKGQKQGLCVTEFTGSDQDIKINYWEYQDWRWVAPEDLAASVHERRREATEKFLVKFMACIN